MNTTTFDNIPLAEMAERLFMTENELKDLLREQGLMSGNTQSQFARSLKIFEVEPRGYRSRGGLVYSSGFDITVTPKGRQFLMQRYGPDLR